MAKIYIISTKLKYANTRMANLMQFKEMITLFGLSLSRREL